jgi:hypothetical protein
MFLYDVVSNITMVLLKVLRRGAVSIALVVYGLVVSRTGKRINRTLLKTPSEGTI